MITLITGAPGAGKTAALVDMLASIGKDRPIYVHGIPELKTPHITLEEPEKWPEVVPDGAVIVIDEVQTVWRPAGPGQKVPEHIAKLETHRHRGLDFYIITQGPNLVHSNVRALVGRHVHLRDLGLLGRHWYEWPETADNCRTGWRSAPIRKRYKLPKRVFGTYKSASLHVKPVRSVPRSLLLLVAALAACGYLGWQAYNIIHTKAFGGGEGAKLQQPAKQTPGTTTTGTTTPGAAPPVVADYDPALFIPRRGDKPESAPAYDALRVVVNMPLVAGGVCMGERCKCVTQQGTDAGLSDADCRKWLANPPFDPYTKAPPPQVTAAAGTTSAGKPHPASLEDQHRAAAENAKAADALRAAVAPQKPAVAPPTQAQPMQSKDGPPPNSPTLQSPWRAV